MIAFEDPDEFGADAHRDGRPRRRRDLLLAGDGTDRRIDHCKGPVDGGRFPLDEVRTPYEVRHKPPVGIEIDLPGRSRLDDAAAFHYRNAVRQRQGLDSVMGHIDGCDRKLGEKAPQLFARLFPEFCVEIAQGLIEEDHLRFGDKGPRQGDPLLLTAAQLCGRPVLEPVELDEMERLFNLFFDLFPGLVPGLKGVGHVVEHVHVGPDGVGLEHHAQPAFLRRDGDSLLRREDHLIPDGDLPRIGHLQTDDAP